MPSDKPPLSDKERRCRQDPVDYAAGSVELSGFRLDAEMKERSRRFVEGELSH